MNSPNNNIYISLFKKFIIYSIIGAGYFLFGKSVFAQEINPNGYNEFYYENGRISSKGIFKNGLPEGIWKSYYPDGTLKSLGEKTDGLSDSLWVFFDSEGRKSKKLDYYNDKKNGCARFFDTLGNTIKELFYINDIAQGERITYYADGSIKTQVSIEDGKEVGLLLEFALNGDIITEEVYDNGFLKDRKEFNRKNENGEKTGVWRDYFSNGELANEITYKDGKKSGLSKFFNEEGKLIDIKKMKGDTIAGNSDEIVIIELYKEYYPNGKLQLVGGNDNGLKNGIFREYDQNGEIINGYIYEKDTVLAEGIISGDGVYQGDWSYFYKTGEIKSKGAYSNGKKEGKWTYYFKNGKKEQEGSYKENKLKGDWIWFYQNGQVRRTEFYNRKELLEGTVNEYDSLGNEMTRGDYYDGKREGDWFYHVGDFKEVGAYTLGMENGVWNYYYLNGKLAFTGAYDEGEAKGKHIYYHKNGIQKEVGKYLGGDKHGKWRTYNRLGEEIQVIEYKRGEIYKIDGFKVQKIAEEN